MCKHWPLASIKQLCVWGLYQPAGLPVVLLQLLYRVCIKSNCFFLWRWWNPKRGCSRWKRGRTFVFLPPINLNILQTEKCGLKLIYWNRNAPLSHRCSTDQSVGVSCTLQVISGVFRCRCNHTHTHTPDLTKANTHVIRLTAERQSGEREPVKTTEAEEQLRTCRRASCSDKWRKVIYFHMRM